MDGQQPAPGWYPDPQTPGMQRYWDGQAWTEHTAPMGQQAGGTQGYGQPGYGQSYGQQGVPMQGQVAQQRSGMAIASMVLGIVGILAVCFCGVFTAPLPLVGLPLGWTILNRIKRGEVPETERGMAMAGVILNAITLALTVLMFVLMLFWFGGSMWFLTEMDNF